jgi:hypothetical protein
VCDVESRGGSDRVAIVAAYEEWEAAQRKVAALSLDALTDPELLALLARREVVYRAQPTVERRQDISREGLLGSQRNRQHHMVSKLSSSGRYEVVSAKVAYKSCARAAIAAFMVGYA